MPHSCAEPPCGPSLARPRVERRIERQRPVSSTQNTTACCGGSTYKPITSAAFVSNGIGRAHIPLESMGLQAGMSPGPRDHRVLDAQFAAERPCGPVRGDVRRRPRFEPR